MLLALEGQIMFPHHPQIELLKDWKHNRWGISHPWTYTFLPSTRKHQPKCESKRGGTAGRSLSHSAITHYLRFHGHSPWAIHDGRKAHTCHACVGREYCWYGLAHSEARMVSRIYRWPVHCVALRSIKFVIGCAGSENKSSPHTEHQ